MAEQPPQQLCDSPQAPSEAVLSKAVDGSVALTVNGLLSDNDGQQPHRLPDSTVEVVQQYRMLLLQQTPLIFRPWVLQQLLKLLV